MEKVVGSRHCIAGSIIALCLGIAGTAGAAGQDKDGPGRAVSDQEASGPAYVYTPPLRGAPRARVGGGTRGAGEQAAKLDVLAPDHIGLTTQAQPVLYWHAHAPGPARFQIALTDDGIDPLLEFETGSRQISGIQGIDLGAHEVTLQPGTTYHWSVALVTDAGSRSANLVSTGMIERIVPGEELALRIDSNTGTDLVAVLAGEGIWYDALATVEDMIAASPGDDSLVAIRHSLLEQVGLAAAAE